MYKASLKELYVLPSDDNWTAHLAFTDTENFTVVIENTKCESELDASIKVLKKLEQLEIQVNLFCDDEGGEWLRWTADHIAKEFQLCTGTFKEALNLDVIDLQTLEGLELTEV